MESSVEWGIQEKLKELLAAIQVNPAYQICPHHESHIEQVKTALEQFNQKR